MCDKQLKYGEVLVLNPCGHRNHKKCWEQYCLGEDQMEMPCPICGGIVNSIEPLIRRKNKIHSLEDRARVLRAAREGGDWLKLSQDLGIKRNTAESWLKSDSEVPNKRGGDRRGILTEDHKERLIALLESDPQITLKEMIYRLGIPCNESTVSRALNGMAFTIKKVHVEPVGMNSAINKEKRRDYVIELQRLMEQGKYLYSLNQGRVISLSCQNKYY